MIWQWDNIVALYKGLVYSQEELEGKMADNDQVIKDAVDAFLTDEDRQALSNGAGSTQDPDPEQTGAEKPPEPGGEQGTSDKPTGTATTPDKPKPEKPKPENPPADKPTEPTAYEKQLSAVIARVYALREDFMGRLEALMNQAIAEFKAIPAEERSAKLASFVSGYLAKWLDMEKECDARIEAIIIELETLLQENNGDLSIAQTVYDTYVEEKSLKKAWYMAELKKRGFV